MKVNVDAATLKLIHSRSQELTDHVLKTLERYLQIDGPENDTTSYVMLEVAARVAAQIEAMILTCLGPSVGGSVLAEITKTAEHLAGEVVTAGRRTRPDLFDVPTFGPGPGKTTLN